MPTRTTKISSKEELKQIFLETLINSTDSLTKVTDNSVLSGIGYGVSSVGQKAIAEIAGVESSLFPDLASGTQLDAVAQNYGISPRFGASGSSTFLRVIGASGTTYVAGTQTFTSTNGVVFSLDEDVTIGSLEFAYAKVSSTTTGQESNVDPLTISEVAPEPTGHREVINEFAAQGGRDAESDDLFRKRIKGGSNILAKGTIAALEQAFIKVNNNVLKVFNQGINANSNLQLAIATQNGVDFTSNELLTLLEGAEDFFSLSDLKPFSEAYYGIDLVNMEYDPIDLNFRVELESGFNADTYRIDVQTRIARYLDFTTFDPITEKVEWDNLLQIAKNADGAKYVPDQFFFLNSTRTDYTVDRSKLPRLRSFAIYDTSGTLIQNLSGTLSPVFYPNQTDLNFQLTAL